MKHNKYAQTQNQPPAGAPRSIAAARLTQDESAFSPSPEEVARKAYFSYVNEGSQPGRDVQHWLAAEAALIDERNLTRIHGFHN